MFSNQYHVIRKQPIKFNVVSLHMKQRRDTNNTLEAKDRMQYKRDEITHRKNITMLQETYHL